MSFFHDLWKKITLKDDPIEITEYHTTWLLRFTRRLNETLLWMYIKLLPKQQTLSNRVARLCLRKLFQFGYGFFLGVLFYFFIVVDLYLDPYSTRILGAIICLLAGIGCILSSQFRCISLLAPMRFGSSTGQSVLTALIIAYLSAGPVTNITENLKESMRVIMCQSVMTFTLTKNKYELMFKPLTEAFAKMRGDTSGLQQTISNVKELTKPLEDEFDDDKELQQIKLENDKTDDENEETRRSSEIEKSYSALVRDVPSKRIEKKYVKKLLYRCEFVITKAKQKCAEVFEKIQNNCRESLPDILSWLCFVLNLKFLCNLFSLLGVANKCNDVSKIIPHGFGQAYEYLVTSKDTLQKEFEEVKLHYRIIEVPPEAKESAKNLYDAGKTVVHQFEGKRTIIEAALLIVMRCIAFSFIFIITGCYDYVYNYLNDIDEDNRYITMYFRKIDYRRHIKGKFTLLPLKSWEKKELSDVYKLSLTDSEKSEFMHFLIRFIILFMGVSLFVLLDYFLYNLLVDLRTHGLIEYIQTGHHDLSIDIRGVGFLASIIRSVAQNFPFKHRVKRKLTNEACLPNPSVPGKYTYRIYGSFALQMLLGLANVYIFKRLNRYVCSIFYPKMEKKRVLYLYNQLFKKRITYLNYKFDLLRRDLAAKKKIPDQLTFYMVLRLKKPKLFGWLTWFESGRRKCLICEEPEPKRGGPFPCANINCYIYFDEQCWNFVVKRECIGCKNYMPRPELYTITSSTI